MKKTEPLFDIIEKLLIFVFDLSEITDKLTKDVEELKKQKYILPTPPTIEKSPKPTPTFTKIATELPPLHPKRVNPLKPHPKPKTKLSKTNLRSEMQKELQEAFTKMNVQDEEK